jgi:UDPglucose 6-dehydrogenase
MHITIVGSGYVGLVTGACLSNTGNDVTCLDIDERRIERLRRGDSPLHEPGLDQLIRRNTDAGRLHFTTDRVTAYGSAEAIFICVGTPPDDTGHADLSAVHGVAADIGRTIEARQQPAEPRKIIVVKSTVPVGTNRRVSDIIGQYTAKPYCMATNPEFMREGSAIHDFSYPDRVVIGVDDEGAGRRLRALYEPFVREGKPIFVVDIASAEMVKYAANTMLATKISFINEIANLCEAYGADIDQVRKGLCSDHRIGNSFLDPGLGYGGSCFPKDVKACISMGNRSGVPAQLLTAVHEVNQRQRQRFANKIVEYFGGRLNGRRLALWGVAFKPGTDDIREAPAITLVQRLLDEGAEVCAFDRVATENCRMALGDRIALADDPMAALDGADGLVICTNWEEFLTPDFGEMRRRMNSPVIFDGRNLYRPEMMQQHGFVYHSVGRKAVSRTATAVCP